MKFIIPFSETSLYTQDELQLMQTLNIGADWFLDWVLHYWFVLFEDNVLRIIDALGSDIDGILASQPESEDGIVMFQTGVLEENIHNLADMQRRVFGQLYPYMGTMPHHIERKAVIQAHHYPFSRNAMVVELELEDSRL